MQQSVNAKASMFTRVTDVLAHFSFLFFAFCAGAVIMQIASDKITQQQCAQSGYTELYIGDALECKVVKKRMIMYRLFF